MKVWLCAWLGLACSLSAGEAPPWRDAVLGLRTDATGAVWNFQENGELGRVGASAVNRGEMLLVDGEAFVSQSAYMSEDGNEFLVSGQLGGAQESLVGVRRVQLDPRSGVVRYVELLRNEGRESRSVQVELRTNLNGYYQRFTSDRGRDMPVALQEDESGFWLAPESGKEGGRGYAFAVAGRGSAIRPVLGSKQSYVVSAYFKLEIAPGETAALLHAIRQAPLESGADAGRLAEVFVSLDLNSLRKALPRSLRKSIRNVAADRDQVETHSFLSPPGNRPNGDILDLSDGGELRGELRTGGISLETVRGKLELDGNSLVAAESAEPNTRTIRVWLRGGEVLRGTVARSSLKFALASGSEIDVRWEGLKRLRRNLSQEVDRSAAWVQTTSDEQLRLSKGWENAKAHWESAYGPVDLNLGQVIGISAQREVWLDLTDGSRVRSRGTGTGAAPLDGKFEGRELPLAEINGFYRPAGSPTSLPTPQAIGFVHTVSGDRLSWVDQKEHLKLETAQGRLSVAMKEVRRMIREGDGFRLTLWDGSQFPARTVAPEETLSLRGAVAWKIPWRDVRELTGPSPQAETKPPGIEAALKGLQADDWPTRHQAEQALRNLGAAAVPQLRRLKESKDADLRHRARLLLEELETDDATAP